MNKMISNIKTLAALLLAGAAFTACSSSDDITADQPAQPAGEQVYTLTVKASKGDATTRGLGLDGNTLKAFWKKDEIVKVYKTDDEENPIGELKPVSTGSNETILTGTIRGTFTTEDRLMLEFLSPNDYASQDGTLEYIEAHCDHARAYVSVTAVSETGITTENATFDNRQAIVKFTLLDAATDKPLKVTSLIVTDEALNLQSQNDDHPSFIVGAPLTITPDNPTNEFFVAISNLNKDSKHSHFVLTATDANSNEYIYTREYTGGTSTYFEHGKYYPITVKMKKGFTTLKEGDVIKVGDLIRLTQEWGVNNNTWYIPAARTGTLVRANIDDKDEVTEAADGAYYVIKYVYHDRGDSTRDYTFYFFDDKSMPVANNSDGLIVEDVGQGSNYPTCTIAVHSVQD